MKSLLGILTYSDVEYTGNPNYSHSTLMMLNTDWSSLGCLFSISLEVGLFFFKIHSITFTQILHFFSGEAVLGHLYVNN
jgi:hypothetical protein